MTATEYKPEQTETQPRRVRRGLKRGESVRQSVLKLLLLAPFALAEIENPGWVWTPRSPRWRVIQIAAWAAIGLLLVIGAALGHVGNWTVALVAVIFGGVVTSKVLIHVGMTRSAIESRRRRAARVERLSREARAASPLAGDVSSSTGTRADR